MSGPTVGELVAAVRAHALEHYTTGGWDYVVECYSDAEIAAEFGDAQTAAAAIAAVGEVVGLHDEMRHEARAAGGEA